VDEIDFAVRKFPAVGRCIYCDATGSLTDEHIVPYFLGGKMTLPASSCQRCQKITHRFETAVAEATKAVRAQWKLPSRRRSWRKLFASGLANPLGIEAPANSDAAFASCLLPILPQPRVVAGVFGQPATLDISGVSIGVTSVHPNPLLWQPESLTFPLRAFEQMLAKIAFSFTVAQVGLDKAPLDLRPHILREDTPLADVVGGCELEIAPSPRPLITDQDGALTYESFVIGHGCLKADSYQHLMVHLQIMRWLGSPTYWVAAGRATDDLISFLGINN
jgi:hypothetical protein